MSRFFPHKLVRARLIVPTDYDKTKDFLPQRTKLAPGRRLLRLGLLAVIAMSDSIPIIDLLQYKSFKKDIWSHHGNHGSLMTGNMKSSAIKNLFVVLEEYKIYMLKSDDYFDLIVETGCSKVVTPNITDCFS